MSARRKRNCEQQANWGYTRRPAVDPWRADVHATPSLNLIWAMPFLALLVFASSKAYFSVRRQVREPLWSFGLSLAPTIANMGVCDLMDTLKASMQHGLELINCNLFECLHI